MAEPTLIDVDKLANEIRRVDGDSEKRLGAGALAEALMPFIERHSLPGGVAGYRLVPEEPADETLYDMVDAVILSSGRVYHPSLDQMRLVYRTMLAASTPPSVWMAIDTAKKDGTK